MVPLSDQAATPQIEGDEQMIKMGQAKIVKTFANGGLILTYKNIGSDLLGERGFVDVQEAAEFMRSHLLTLVR